MGSIGVEPLRIASDVRASLVVLLPAAASATRLRTDAKEARDHEVAGTPRSWGRAIPDVRELC